MKFQPRPTPSCSVQATAGCPVASPRCQLPIADRAFRSCCCTPLHRCRMPQHAAAALTVMPWPSACCQESHAALPTGSYARVSLGHRLPPPPVVPCSPATSCVPARPFAVWCTLFYRMVPRHSLPLKRGADSCITPKRVASRQVAATMLESPRCQTRAWKPPLCRALR
jgi:hypothetical protein